MASNNLYDLLSAMSSSLSESELLLATQKGLIASEISMKRQDLGMTQKELADAVGVKQSQVSRWEKGETNFTLDTLCKIAIALDIKMQSPFILRPKNKNYINSGNIIPIYSAKSWNKSYSAPQNYVESESDDLKEM